MRQGLDETFLNILSPLDVGAEHNEARRAHGQYIGGNLKLLIINNNQRYRNHNAVLQSRHSILYRHGRKGFGKRRSLRKAYFPAGQKMRKRVTAGMIWDNEHGTLVSQGLRAKHFGDKVRHRHFGEPQDKVAIGLVRHPS
jgi:hypothetical protein